MKPRRWLIVLLAMLATSVGFGVGWSKCQNFERKAKPSTPDLVGQWELDHAEGMWRLHQQTNGKDESREAFFDTEHAREFAKTKMIFDFRTDQTLYVIRPEGTAEHSRWDVKAQPGNIAAVTVTSLDGEHSRVDTLIFHGNNAMEVVIEGQVYKAFFRRVSRP